MSKDFKVVWYRVMIKLNWKILFMTTKSKNNFTTSYWKWDTQGRKIVIEKYT
jgi:hypothetical protein